MSKATNFLSRSNFYGVLSREQVATIDLLQHTLLQIGLLSSSMDITNGYVEVVKCLYENNENKKIQAIKTLRAYLEVWQSKPVVKIVDNIVSDGCTAMNVEWKETIGLKEAKHIVEWIQAHESSLRETNEV